MNNMLLDELVKGEWLMSLHHLYGYKHHISEMKQPAVIERPLPEEAISFFNEDYERINPRDISEIPEGSIAVISMIGGMVKYWNWWMTGADEIVAQLDWANNLSAIKAIIVIIDGPGGSVSSIPLFIDFAARKKKPIVALMDNSLSLHRWIPDAIADKQFAANNISARFGSIGVVSSWLDVSKYWEDMGVVEKEVYPEESKHKNEIWRAMKEDEEKGMQMLRDEHLAPIAKKFQAAVKTAHPDLIEEEGVLSGRTFSAEDAVRLNMIDGIGTMADAMQRAQILGETGTFKTSI